MPLKFRPLPVLALGLWMSLAAAAPPLSFTSLEPRFENATDRYRSLWNEEGDRIVAALERTAGISFPPAPIEVIVNGRSTMTALDGRTIRFRAGYSRAFAKGTLVHEMGHRLALGLTRTAEIDDHRVLYLFLYDAWTDLYGRDFADRMVALERRFANGYDYDGAWRWALSMNRAQRQSRLKWLRNWRRSPAGEVAPAS